MCNFIIFWDIFKEEEKGSAMSEFDIPPIDIIIMNIDQS